MDTTDTIQGLGYLALIQLFHQYIRPQDDTPQNTLFVRGKEAQDYLLTVETVYVTPEIPTPVKIDCAFRYHLDETEADALLCVIQEPFKRSKRDVCALTGDGIVWWESEVKQTYRMGYRAIRHCAVEHNSNRPGLRLIDGRDAQGFWLPLALHEALISGLAQFIEAAGPFIKNRQVDLNAATADELSQLPGLTSTEIEALLSLRKTLPSGFEDLDTVANTLHWSPTFRQRLLPWLHIPTATTLPGVQPTNTPDPEIHRPPRSPRRAGRKIDS